MGPRTLLIGFQTLYTYSMRAKRGLVPMFRSLLVSSLSLAIVLTSPGASAYAAVGKILQGKQQMRLGGGSPARLPALAAGINAALPAGKAPLAGSPSLPAVPQLAAPKAAAQPASQTEASAPKNDRPILQSLGSLKQKIASVIGVPVKKTVAGSAFGMGDTHTVAAHTRTNQTIAQSLGANRGSLAYGNSSEPGLPEASPVERAALGEAIQSLDLENKKVDVDGLGTVVLSEVLSALKRVVLVDPGQGQNPLALRHESSSEFQVSHVGFGAGRDAPTIYVSKTFLASAGAGAVAAVLYNDLIELGARRLAQAASVDWSESLSRKVQDLAAAHTSRRWPRVFHAVRALVGGHKADFNDLGISPEATLREYLADDSTKQQVLLNRLAALRAKGFEPVELNAELLRAQASLDHVIEAADPARQAEASVAALKALRDSNAAVYDRLTVGVDLKNLFDASPALMRLPSDAHSQVQGLALRIDLALRSGRDAGPMLRALGHDPKPLSGVWHSWDQGRPAAAIPVLDQVPNVRTTLSGALEKVRVSALSEKTLAANEIKALEGLIKKHPLAGTWLEMLSKLRALAQQLRSELKELPVVRGNSPKARALRELKGHSREEIAEFEAQASGLKERVSGMQERAEPLAMLSLAMREWFPGMKGLSVAGDYLWDKEGRGLEMLMLVPGDSSPRELRPEVLKKVTGLGGDLEIRGTVVGEKWLRGVFFDAQRNEMLSRFSLLGLSLWGPNITTFSQVMPERELWAAAQAQLTAARQELSSRTPVRAGRPLVMALNLMTALALRLQDGPNPELIKLLKAQTKFSNKRNFDAASVREALVPVLESADAVMAGFQQDGRRTSLSRRLLGVFDKENRQDAPGQIGGVLMSAASARVEGAGQKYLYELSSRQARHWLEETARSGKSVAGAAESVTAVLGRLQGKARYWDWLPETLELGRFARVGATAFGRPVEVRVEVSELSDRPELLGLVAHADEGSSSPGTDRYVIFLNGAALRMEPHVSEAVLGSLLRQVDLAMRGMPLNEAREKSMAELGEMRVRDDQKDREVIERAIADYRGGVKIEALAEDKEALASASQSWRRRARRDDVLRLGQAVSDYLNAPQRKLSGSILLGYTTEAMLPLVRDMAEVFAGNGLNVTIAEGPTLSASLHHAVREGSYRLGFLMSRDAVVPFGHFKGQIPEDELKEISAAENAVRRVRRLDFEAARLFGRVLDRGDVQTSYLASLKERFDTRRIAESSLRLVIDSDQSEIGVLMRGLGLENNAVDLGGNVDALKARLRETADGERRLGVVMDRDGSSIKILDVDGQAIAANDLSLLFTWYLVTHRNHKGKIFRAFTQTRLLDRLAAKRGLGLEEVDPAVWGISEADSVILSPWTPYNDFFSQALLAAEIVDKTGKSLREVLGEVHAELGSALHYEKASLAVPAAYLDRVGDRLSAQKIQEHLSKELAIAGVRARESHNGIQVSLPEGGWLYLRRSVSGVEFYAENADAGAARRMIQAAQEHVRGLLSEMGPSRAVKTSFLFTTLVVGLGAALLLLPLIDPSVALQTPVLGAIYQLVGRIVELGFGALEWLFPNVLRKVMPSWNNRGVMMMSVLMFVEFFWYWGMRAVTFSSSVLRTRPQGELAAEIERLPDLPRQSNPDANDYAIVAPIKDGRLAALKPAFSRVWQWLQPLLFTYQAQTLIQGKSYDDSNVVYRSAINARGWLFFKALLLEPRIMFMTWRDLFSAAMPATASLVGASSGLPTHVSPAAGVPLPASLRGRYRTELALVKKVSDGDTIQLFDGNFWGSRWVRYKGMDASDFKKGDLYHLAKERNIQMVRGKKVLLLIPQIKEEDHLADEYDVHGRVLAYVFAQDSSGQWVNMSRLLLQEGLATTDKGAPDPEVPYSLDVTEPKLRQKSVLAAQQQARPASIESEALPREAVLTEAQARQALKDSGAQAAESAQVSFSASFAGKEGKLLKRRLGAQAVIGENSQLFVSGSGALLGEKLNLKADARLHLAAQSEDGAAAGEIEVGNDVSVEGQFRVTVAPGGRLRVLNGTKLTGSREISVLPGQKMSLRTLSDGTLSLQSEERGPLAVLRGLWKGLKRGLGLESALESVRTNHLSAQDLKAVWRREGGLEYETVHMPAKLSLLKSVSPERAGALESKHASLVSKAVEAKKRQLLRSQTLASRKFLFHKGAGEGELKQALLIGLERHYSILGERSQSVRIKAMEAKELGLYASRAKERLAALSGLLLLGPQRLPESLGVVLGGDYLFSSAPRSLELLVVVPGAEGPKLMDSSLLRGVSLPDVEELKLTSVGEEWLRVSAKDGMRNRLLTRFLATGTTLWGQDLAALRADSVGHKVPRANLLALSSELIEEAGNPAAQPQRAREALWLAHFVLLSAAPGLLERVVEDKNATVEGLLQTVRRQQNKVQLWLDSERLREVVGQGMNAAAVREPAAGDFGVGGVTMGGDPAMDKLAAAAPVENAQEKIDSLLERLKSRGLWWMWYPSRLEEGNFVVIGRDSRGRTVETRVRVGAMPEAVETLAVISRSPEEPAVSDVDRYEIFLNGALFELDPSAQEIALGAVTRQLEMVLAGKTLREAKDVSSRELIEKKGSRDRSQAQVLLDSLADFSRGVRVASLGAVRQLPWDSSTWKGALGEEDGLRLAQGLSGYLISLKAASPAVSIGYSSEQGKIAAERMAGVFAAKGVRARLLQGAHGETVLAEDVRQGPAEMGIWIDEKQTKILGKDGLSLPMTPSNTLGWLMMRENFSRSLPLALAREQGLVEDVVSPTPSQNLAGLPQALSSVEGAPARSSAATFGAFSVHAALVGLIAGIFAGAIFFPTFFASLPFVSTIFTMVRSMMMFKSLLIADYAWVVGLTLASVVTVVRYVRYGKIMYQMSKGEGRYQGLTPELENIPRVHTQPLRGEMWTPVKALPDGRISIREDGFARLSPVLQLLVYTHAAARVRFLQNPVSRFFINMSNKLIIGRFKVAKITFFVLTEPLVMLLEAGMLWDAFSDWMRGRPVNLLYRVRSESSRGLPALPEAASGQFQAEWVTVTAIVNDNTVQLEDGRTIRVIGAGKPGLGVSLATAEARSLFLQGQEVMLIVPTAQEEGTRRIAGHLYTMGAKNGEASHILTRAIHALAAESGMGRRLPGVAAVDSDKLPLFLDINETQSKPKEEQAPIGTGEKAYAWTALSLLAAAGVGAFMMLSGAALSPLAHGLGVAALGTLLLPAAYGVIRLLKDPRRGFMLKHKMISAALISSLLLGILAPLRGSNPERGPAATTLSGMALRLLESALLLPRPARLGFESVQVPSLGAEQAYLPEGHVLVKQARELFSGKGASSEALNVGLPAELSGKYTGLWAYVTKVIDGDTISLSNGYNVRYLAYNAPETFHPGFSGNEAAQPGGDEAHHRNAELVGNKKVLLLIPKERGKDHYRRILAYVYAPDGFGKLVNANVTLLEEGHGNARYGLPEAILRGKYRTIDPSTLTQGAVPAPEKAAPASKKLRLNPNETRHNIQEAAVVKRWIDGQTLELSDGRTVRLRELDVEKSKDAAARKYVGAIVKPGQEVILLHTKPIENTPGTPYQKNEEGHILDYVFVPSADGSQYLNLNAMVFAQGLSTTRQGKPDAAVPERAVLETETFDYQKVAWELSQAPLRSLRIGDSRLMAAYGAKVSSLDSATAKPFQAAASLLAFYADQMMVPAAQHEELLGALLQAKSPADYDHFVKERLVPALRVQLKAQGISQSEDWKDVLVWAAAGKLGASSDAAYFPAKEQAAQMREFLNAQGVLKDSPSGVGADSAALFGEGVLFAKLSLKLPPSLRLLVSKNTVASSAGSFWAAAELGRLHSRLLYQNSRVSPLLMSMSYAYAETPHLMMSQARRYVALTELLGREVLSTPGLTLTSFRHLAKILPEQRLVKVRAMMENGQGNAAIKELSPVELFTLGRMFADEPELNRYMLSNLKELRALAGRLAVQGTPQAAFEKELDALLALPGGGSVSGSPMEGYSAIGEDDWKMQRKLFAEILVQTLISMDKENVPARLLPMLLPRAAEAVERASGKVSASGDWQGVVKAVRKITPGQARSWVYELMPHGLSVGQELNVGFGRRDIGHLLTEDLSAKETAKSNKEKKVVGTLGFSSYFESDLRTFKHGAFRMDEGNEHVYESWKKGDMIKIMVGKKANRQALFNTKIVSVQRVKISDLSLDDLRGEFPPTRFWNPVESDESLRAELIKELVANLQKFHPEVSENSEGTMILFKSFPEMRQRNQSK